MSLNSELSKTSRPVLGSSLLALLLSSSSVMALDKGVCYSIQVQSAPISSTVKLNIEAMPSYCELLHFTNTKSIRCGCYNSLEEANEQLENILPMRKNASIVETRISRFKNVSLTQKEPASQENNATIISVTPVVVSTQDNSIKAKIKAPIETSSIVVATSDNGQKRSEIKKDTPPDSAKIKDDIAVETSSVAVVSSVSDTKTSALNKEVPVEQAFEEDADLDGFTKETSDSQTATASFTKETSDSQTATASFTKETSAAAVVVADLSAEDDDLAGFLEESDLDGFSEENSDLDGFSEEDADLDGFASEDASLAGFDDGDLDGFADEDSARALNENEYSVDEKISAMENLIGKSRLSGKLAFKTMVGIEKHEVEGIEYSGVNQAQTSLYLQFDKKLSSNWKVRISGDAYYDAIYDINDHNDYNDGILEEYRTQLRFDDTYIQGRLNDDIDLKAGRQIVIWGKSDNIRITDVINPTDNRLPGVTDIEYIRLPVTMAKFDWYVGDWDMAAMVIPEARVSIAPPIGSEFFPTDSSLIDGITPPLTPTTTPTLQEPASSWDNMQYGLAANGVFSGWDLSFYAANIFDKDNHSDEVITVGATPSDFVYSKIYMLGTAFNMVQGSWLIKGEAALLNGLRYSTTSDEKNRLDTLLGLEYMGFANTSMSLELANRHIFSHEAVMNNAPDSVDKNTIQTIVRVTRNFMHETLEVTALANILGPDFNQGGFARVWGEYELAEALSLDLGVVFYQGGTNAYFEAIKANDRIFANITYSF